MEGSAGSRNDLWRIVRLGWHVLDDWDGAESPSRRRAVTSLLRYHLHRIVPEAEYCCARLRRHASVPATRIWLILIHGPFSESCRPPCTVKGNPARGSRLVTATGIMVPDRSLNPSWLRTRTGRRPACSFSSRWFSLPDSMAKRVRARPRNLSASAASTASLRLETSSPLD